MYSIMGCPTASRVTQVFPVGVALTTHWDPADPPLVGNKVRNRRSQQKMHMELGRAEKLLTEVVSRRQ